MARSTLAVTVADKKRLSPNMMRLMLQGDSLKDFPTGYEGGYIKLVFPGGLERPVVRSYTVREFSADTRVITIDMVAHGDTGPAATWASNTSIGDEVQITGPGACKPINTSADRFILAGDMSAMPAISVNINRLPADAIGDIVLEVISKEDQLELPVPKGMNLHWVVNPDPDAPNTMLEDSVMALPWRDGEVSVWVAGEFSASRALRQYFRHEKSVRKENMYVSCYWKIGENDEGMKAAKQADKEAW